MFILLGLLLLRPHRLGLSPGLRTILFFFLSLFFPCDTKHEQLEGALGQIREQWGQL